MFELKPRSINIFLLDGDPNGIRVAQISMGALGWDLFREVRGRLTEPSEQMQPTPVDPSPIFFFRGEGFSAEMTIAQSGDFVVKAGSKARARTTPTIPKGTLALRDTLQKSGVLQEDAGSLIFASD